MDLRQELTATLREHGWAAVAEELTAIAARRHPQSLLYAGLRMAALQARHTAAGAGRWAMDPPAVGQLNVAAGSPLAPRDVAGGPDGARSCSAVGAPSRQGCE